MLEEQIELLRRVTTAIGRSIDHDTLDAELYISDKFTVDEVSWRESGEIRVEGTKGDQLVDITLRVASVVIGASE